MPVLLLLLLAGVVIYFVVRHRTSTLTRDCRWRQERTQNRWRCAFCGAVRKGDAQPRDCLKECGPFG